MVDVPRSVSYQISPPASRCAAPEMDPSTKGFSAAIKGNDLELGCSDGTIKIPLKRLRAVIRELYRPIPAK